MPEIDRAAIKAFIFQEAQSWWGVSPQRIERLMEEHGDAMLDAILPSIDPESELYGISRDPESGEIVDVTPLGQVSLSSEVIRDSISLHELDPSNLRIGGIMAVLPHFHGRDKHYGSMYTLNPPWSSDFE